MPRHQRRGQVPLTRRDADLVQVEQHRAVMGQQQVSPVRVAVNRSPAQHTAEVFEAFLDLGHPSAQNAEPPLRHLLPAGFIQPPPRALKGAPRWKAVLEVRSATVELTEQAAEFAERKAPRPVLPVVPPNGDSAGAAHKWLFQSLEGQGLGSRNAFRAKTTRELDGTGDRLRGSLRPRHAQERLQGRGVEQRVLAKTHQAQFGTGTPEFLERLLSVPFGVTRSPWLRTQLCHERIEVLALCRQICIAYPDGPAIPSISLPSEPTRPRTCHR